MSDFLFNDGESDETEDWAAFSSDDDETTDAPDPGVVAFLDQETAKYHAAKDAFAEHYGFTHDCRCDKDYSSGNMVEVTECFAQMADDAVKACAVMHAENKLLKNLIKAAIGDALVEVPEGGDDAIEVDLDR